MLVLYSLFALGFTVFQLRTDHHNPWFKTLATCVCGWLVAVIFLVWSAERQQRNGLATSSRLKWLSLVAFVAGLLILYRHALGQLAP